MNFPKSYKNDGAEVFLFLSSGISEDATLTTAPGRTWGRNSLVRGRLGNTMAIVVYIELTSFYGQAVGSTVNLCACICVVGVVHVTAQDEGCLAP